MASTDTHTTVELLEAVFSVRSIPRLYNEEQLRLRESLETAVRRVGGCFEMAASLRGQGTFLGSVTKQRLVKTHQIERNQYVL
jgi:hypothetical protein